MPNEQVKTIKTPTEAVAFIKRLRGKSFFVSCGQHAPIADAPGKVFPILGNVRVSQKLAAKFVRDAYSETMESRGALVEITELGDCVFIGRAS